MRFAASVFRRVRGERFHSRPGEVFAKANEEKSGDQLAAIAARTERERVAAKIVLADLTFEEIVDHPLIDPEMDEVSRLILESHDRVAFEQLRGFTVGEFREWILDDAHERSHARGGEAWADARGCGGGRQN